ncbi:MAG: 5-oxoprolinase subunit B family protein [Marmoricola sp.]
MTDALVAEPYGTRALLIRSRPDQTLAVAERARARWPEASDVVPAADTVLVDGILDVVAAVAEVRGWSVAPTSTTSNRLVELPTRYDGPDLTDVATLWGVTADQVVEIHTSRFYVVAFCGFAPGFAYCTGLPPDRAVSRRPNPRSRVEAGSVALADIYTGVYPTASPGGWQVIGRTEASLWDLSRDEPALLTPGTGVRFIPQ